MSSRPAIPPRLCLVGMSGVGKSFWAARLAAVGMHWHDCDTAIARELGSLVRPEPGEAPVHALGRWMGMPWSPGYAEREARYLALEERVTSRELDAFGAPGAHVLDTTGSVVYLGTPLVERIARELLVVYLRTPRDRYAAMLQRYLDEPKPVVWDGVYAPLAGESPEASLSRCYARLLGDRDARYLRLAHVVLDAGVLETRDPGIDGFLAACAAGAS